ncbi:potassium channel protein [Marinobacterium nitratireducens]|uniref:Potassium channel protein n=1 Tax=Marinobacterium nitratireducens TaxID=518897 RepID=A0A917ZHV6_9GAMM|nr:potassium channel family protein [Marinobacterium nitratireducens]GGO83271.1 potassium channel protein [Marinobacterium nitratireducens]
MPLIKRLRKLIYHHFKDLKWQGLLLLLTVYILVNWLVLRIIGETALAGPDYLYWLLVTASTVGYGDLSPQTGAGKLYTALVIIPFGLGLFAMTVGKIAAFSAYQWRKGLMGLKDLNLRDHILVIGWDPERTPHLLRLLRIETEQHHQRTLCLCASADIENPMPGEIEFVRVSAYNEGAEMDRACIEQASRIIIDCARDDSTLAAALYSHSRNPDAHTIAYFRDEALARLLKHHCPNIECTPSVAVELMVKAAMDPGSSALHQQLLTAAEGMTQYAIRYPQGLPSLPIRQLFVPFKERYQATLIAVDVEADGQPEVNPELDLEIHAGSLIYYIAPQRIREFDWARLTSGQ